MDIASFYAGLNVGLIMYWGRQGNKFLIALCILNIILCSLWLYIKKLKQEQAKKDAERATMEQSKTQVYQSSIEKTCSNCFCFYDTAAKCSGCKEQTCSHWIRNGSAILTEKGGL